MYLKFPNRGWNKNYNIVVMDENIVEELDSVKCPGYKLSTIKH